jgi:hypothetical protein
MAFIPQTRACRIGIGRYHGKPNKTRTSLLLCSYARDTALVSGAMAQALAKQQITSDAETPRFGRGIKVSERLRPSMSYEDQHLR